MRVLRPVVCSQAPIVLSREPDRAERCRIGSQPVGHNPARRKAVLLKQFHHEFLCGLCIPSALDEEIQHLTLVVDRPPEPVFTAADRNHHFIEVPMIARSRPRTADIRRDRRPELQEPPPDRLVGCVNTSLGQQFLDIPKGQCEPGIEPDRVADDFWREAVALKRYRSHPMMLIGDEPQSYPSYRDIALNSPEKNSLIWLLGNLAGSHLGTGRTPKQEGQQKASEKASNMGNVSNPSHISGSVGVRNCSNATEEL